MKRALAGFKKLNAVLVVATMAGIQFFFATVARAQGTGKPEDLVPCAGAECDWCDVFKLLQNVFNTAALLLSLIIIVFIVYGGVLYIIGATAGSDTQIKRAKEIVGDAITGLIIALLSFIIVNAAIVGLTGARIEDFLNVTCNSGIFPQ